MSMRGEPPTYLACRTWHKLVEAPLGLGQANDYINNHVSNTCGLSVGNANSLGGLGGLLGAATSSPDLPGNKNETLLSLDDFGGLVDCGGGTGRCGGGEVAWGSNQR